MKPVKFTSPATGLDFEGLRTDDGNVIFKNPIDGSMSELFYDYVSDTYTVNARLFEHVEIVEASRAMDILEVSRARIAAIISNQVIPYFTVHGRKFFKVKDLEDYAKHRKRGRPSKGK